MKSNFSNLTLYYMSLPRLWHFDSARFSAISKNSAVMTQSSRLLPHLQFTKRFLIYQI